MSMAADDQCRSCNILWIVRLNDVDHVKTAQCGEALFQVTPLHSFLIFEDTYRLPEKTG